jgi:hypothetical protein
VFVDAALPPEHGRAALVPEPFLDHLRTLAVDGRLPKWSEWFGPDALVALVPDAARREALVAEMPELPLAYFEARVPMPDGWSEVGVTYVLLSNPYRDDAAVAAARGWTVAELLGTHLDIVTRPDEIVDALEASLGPSGEHG